jgi:hypothetical protein
MPYPLLLEDSSRISRRHRRREELLECFRLLREGDANDRELAQRLSTNQRPPLQELPGIDNTHRQQEMVPPNQHFRHFLNTNTLFVNTTDSTMQHEAKRRRVACAPSVVTKSNTQHDIHSSTTTTTPSEYKAKKRSVTFAPTIATYSTLQQQYEQKGDHETNQQRGNSVPSMNRCYMTENDFEPAHSRYPRMRASSLALPDYHFAQTNNARAPFGREATFPSGPSFRNGSSNHLSSDLHRPPLYSANPRMYSFSTGRGKPASLMPSHPLGNRAAVAAIPPITHGTKRMAL